jgi:hypothetical protein
MIELETRGNSVTRTTNVANHLRVVDSSEFCEIVAKTAVKLIKGKQLQSILDSRRWIFAKCLSTDKIFGLEVFRILEIVDLVKFVKFQHFEILARFNCCL